VSARVAQMSDAQIHQAVTQLDSLQPGGDSGLGVIIGLLVIAILVVVLLQLTGHRVVITK
jgi:type II secretory pathway component PulF